MLKSLLILLIILGLALPLFAQEIDTAWVRRYNGPGSESDISVDLIVDHSGNVYLTGRSYGEDTDYDFATIKYYPNGDTAWIRRYNGPGNSFDEASGIAIDAVGNLYVTGSCYIDSLIQVDYTTIKYYPNGEIAWVRTYNGPDSNSDIAVAIAIDLSGNIYVSGYSFYDSTSADFLTVKYDSSGNQLWASRYNGKENFPDFCRALAIDSLGNSYVTGTSYSSSTSDNYTTIKYYPNGDTAWVREYNGSGSGADQAVDVAVDVSGNIYVTGISFNSGTFSDITTIKYYPDGAVGWIRSYNGTANGTDIPEELMIDNSGNIYVTGRSNQPGSWPTFDWVTIKHFATGDTAWVRRYNGPGNYEDGAYDIAIDGSGNAYVTGYSFLGGWPDCVTIKYNSAGNMVWIERYDGSEHIADYSYAIALDGSGNVHITGSSEGSGTYEDYVTLKYSQFRWGDVNGDDLVTMSDVIYLTNYLFRGGPPPDPIQAGDANCDSQVTISDAIFLINYLFKGGPPPSC